MVISDRGVAPFSSALPVSLIDEPLDYILADNIRQRGLCSALHDMAGLGRAECTIASSIIAFLEGDMLLHHQDEDEDLFPAIRKRALPEDDLHAALTQLSNEHERSEDAAQGIVSALAARLDDDVISLTPETRKMMLAYVSSEHRHLAVENNIILTIARIRLTRRDLKTISFSMKNRRRIIS